MSLNTEQMVEVASVFKEAYEHVIGNLTVDVRNKIYAFTGGIVLQDKPYMLLTPDGIERAINLVFTDDQHRDFILTLSFVFFSRWSTGKNDLDELSDNLAAGVSHSGFGAVSGFSSNSKVTNALPGPMLTRLPVYNDARSLIGGNKWIVILLLMQLFISIPTSEKSKK